MRFTALVSSMALAAAAGAVEQPPKLGDPGLQHLDPKPFVAGCLGCLLDTLGERCEAADIVGSDPDWSRTGARPKASSLNARP